MSFYLDKLTHKQHEDFDALSLPEALEDFIDGWLLEYLDDKAKWTRQIRVTIEFVPTPEESQIAADNEYFDEEYD